MAWRWLAVAAVGLGAACSSSASPGQTGGDTASLLDAAADSTATAPADEVSSADAVADTPVLPEDASAADAGPLDADLPDTATETADSAADVAPPDAATDSAAGDDSCPDRAKIVYVVTQENKLFSFNPDTLKTNLVGNLNCPGQIGTPFSMGVDRQATAWVVFNNGDLFQVSTLDASCAATSYVSGQAGFSVFGMGFAADSPGALTEKLYVVGGSPGGFIAGPNKLATIDLTSFKLTTVAKLSPITTGPDLSGNGNGELWGFFGSTSPPSVHQIDKLTATVGKAYPLPAADFEGVMDWAFASWGGDFYLFARTTKQAKTAVYRLDGSTGVTTKVISNFGYVVVGAGVSSCAPTGMAP